MLMMGFFVILWVLKPPAGKQGAAEAAQQSNDNWIKVAGAVRAAFGYVPNPASKDPIDIAMLKHPMSMSLRSGTSDGGRSSITPHGTDGNDPDVTDIRPSKNVTEGGKMIFDRQSAELTADTKAELDQVAEMIRGHRNIVMVKGHTSLDDFPDGATAQQKMDLSIRRAQAVADYLTHTGVDPEILRIQGCSTYEPLVQHQYNPDSQAMNRRAEVEVTSNLVEEMQDTKPQSATAPQGAGMDSSSTSPSGSSSGGDGVQP